MKPLKLTAEQAQAAHEGLKTQHREIINPQPEFRHGVYFMPGESTGFGEALFIHNSPYSIGDKVFVKETWSGPIFVGELPEDWQSEKYKNKEHCAYKGRGDDCEYMDADDNLVQRWKPSTCMPQWASRTTLEITNIRVDRLCEISEDDAKAEGVKPYFLPVHPEQENKRHILGFSESWNAIHGLDAWDKNPYVFVYEFRRVEG